MRPFLMSYVRGEDRGQAALLPAEIEDYVMADAPVRVIDAFVDGLDVKVLGFGRSVPAMTGRPPYDPRDLLKLYLYGHLNEVRSSRRLERECSRNVEVMWLLRRLAPDDRGLSPGQWCSDRRGMPGVCAVLPGSGVVHGAAGGS
jgi:transposase